ncbi:DUF2795 domain-containing protein [Bounagaea algeriensis]
MMGTDSKSVKQALSSLDFPASKDRIVTHAHDHGADAVTVRALRAMPVADYDNLQEVLRSVPLDSEAEEGRTHGQKSQQASQPEKGSLAEQQARTPAHPIVDEIGRNRRT